MFAARAKLPALSSIVIAGLLAGCTAPSATTPPSATAGSSASQAAEPPSPSPLPTATPTPTPAPTATPVAAIPVCNATRLAARITAWDAGAGQRVAHVEVTNTASATCRIRALDQPQLVDGPGAVLINGAVPAASSFRTLTPGAVLKTLVEDSNYCGPAPVAPVSVAFVYPGGAGRFVATPLSPTDTSGVPPCFGAPGSAGSITMQPWAA